MIFFERSDLEESNSSLIEIKNPDLLMQLKQDYESNKYKYGTTVPQIMGSVVNKAFNNKTFDRRLKMIPAPLYTFLTVSQTKDLIKDKKYTNNIKSGVIKLL